MKAVILGAGYAVRLMPLTTNCAKPLLPLGGKPIIERIIEKIQKIKDIDKIYIVSNHKFYKNYKEWLNGYKKRNSYARQIKVLDDGSVSNDDKLGAIGDIQFAIDKAKIKDDILIIAGDNIFEFDLKKFVKFHKEKGIILALKFIKDKSKLHKFGIIQTDTNNRIINFEEKPKNPKSNLIATCCYMFPKETIRFYKEYLEAKKTKDAPGYYIQWLSKRQPVYGFIFKKSWHDIGDLESYKKADELYS